MKEATVNDETEKGVRRRRLSFFSILKGIFLCFFFLSVGLAALASVVGVIVLQDITRDLPPIEQMKGYVPSLTSVVYDRKDRVIARLFEENRTWADIRQISPWAIKAILAAEDSEFYEHQGIRLKAIARAIIRDLESGEARQGGSTITQQLARMLFLTRERTFQRKASEAIIAIRMERLYTKDQILEMYINMAYFGHGAYGIGAASQVFYGKTPAQLTLAEASMLAGILPAPNAYTPIRHPDRAATRQNYVLSRMVEVGMITQEEKTQAQAAELTYARKAEAKASFVMEDAPYFVSHVLFKHLLPKYGREKIYRGGLRVQTTIDLDLQRQAEEVISKMKFEGALVALDPNTGEILALVGGRNFDESKFNRATQAYRQPGSAFKPIVYATALENGYRPVDHAFDAPLHFANGWSPKNSDVSYRGEMTLTAALAQSINTVAVRVAQVVGVPAIREQARNMGITTPYLPEDLSIALGSSSLTPLEMGAAFSVFANNGYRIVPFSVKEILDSNGNSLERNGPDLGNALSPETAVTMRSLLMQAVSWGTGTRARVEGYQVFGKTGTTNDWTDVWFVGGVPDLVVVVYVGNDNHKSLGRAFGGTVAAPVWKEFVTQAVQTLGTPKEFKIPPGVGVESVTICRATGFLATKSCPQKANIMIAVGQAPETYCPWHGGDILKAQSDPNAPQLMLTPEDALIRDKYQLAALRTEDSVAVEEIFPTIPPPLEEQMAPLPNMEYEPYRNDPSPASDIEKRYQDLLDQYNIR
ncbi:MAG: PBP1A family penicillin-binding protein [Synergistaceae bacterium]|jgi:penicillin-binding protein 1A|nr:PBP1A family penicillin-binding protein [Synergistaceae bacterium]